jgi:ABC-2 type transport system ATP-binding protein
LQEVSAVSTRVVVISEGRIIADGTVDDLRRRASRSKKVRVTVASTSPEIERELKGLEATVTAQDGHLRADFSGRTGAEVFDMLKSRNWPVREIAEDQATLEDAFVELIRESKR